MDSIITSTAATSKKFRRRGMTLVELMFATGLGTLVLAAVMTLTVFSARSFAAVTNYIDLEVRSRGTLDRMSQEIRQADAVTVCDSTQLTLIGKEPVSGAGYTLTYTYRPSLKT